MSSRFLNVLVAFLLVFALHLNVVSAQADDGQGEVKVFECAGFGGVEIEVVTACQSDLEYAPCMSRVELRDAFGKMESRDVTGSFINADPMLGLAFTNTYTDFKTGFALYITRDWSKEMQDGMFRYDGESPVIAVKCRAFN